MANAVGSGLSCLFGQLAGDALGRLVEFQTPEHIRREYPKSVSELLSKIDTKITCWTQGLGKIFHLRRHATFEPIIVVRVENITLAACLGPARPPRALEPARKHVSGGDLAVAVASVGTGTPHECTPNPRAIPIRFRL